MLTPDIRVDPPLAGTEKNTLVGFLDWLRSTVELKVGDLAAEDLGRTHSPSSITLGGLVKHLAYVENYWFRVVMAGDDAGEPWSAVDWDADPDWDWNSAVQDNGDQIFALWRREVNSARAITKDHGTDDLAAGRRGSEDARNLRWILTHMIEEYARHLGHVDLIRESIDGRIGE